MNSSDRHFIWSAAGSEAPRRFGGVGRPVKSGVAAALCPGRYTHFCRQTVRSEPPTGVAQIFNLPYRGLAVRSARAVPDAYVFSVSDRPGRDGALRRPRRVSAAQLLADSAGGLAWFRPLVHGRGPRSARSLPTLNRHPDAVGLLPAGDLIIARQFTAGFLERGHPSPEGTAESFPRVALVDNPVLLQPSNSHFGVARASSPASSKGVPPVNLRAAGRRLNSQPGQPHYRGQNENCCLQPRDRFLRLSHFAEVRLMVHEWIQPSLRDLCICKRQPGSKLPGYSQNSLRERRGNQNVQIAGRVQTHRPGSGSRLKICATPKISPSCGRVRVCYLQASFSVCVCSHGNRSSTSQPQPMNQLLCKT